MFRGTEAAVGYRCGVLVRNMGLGMCLSRGGRGGGGLIWRTAMPPRPLTQKFRLGKNAILNRDPKMRGLFWVHRLFPALIPPSRQTLSTTLHGAEAVLVQM